MVLRRSARQGALARRVMGRTYGDIDAAGATLQDRLAIIRDTADTALVTIAGNGALRVAAVEERIARADTWLADRAAARERRTTARRAAIDGAARWRATGVQERYAGPAVPGIAVILIMVGLGGVDFAVFAQAYAFAEDVPDLSIQWWLGGVLGLAAFGSGIALARQLKVLVVGRAQRSLVEAVDAAPRPDLVVMGGSASAVSGTALAFAVLCAAGLVVRLESGDQSLGVLLLQAFIPVVVVVIELFLHDPLDRREPSENTVDRLIRRRVRTLEHRRDRTRTAVEHYLEQVSRSFDIEYDIALVIAADLGMTAEPTAVPEQRNGRVPVHAEAVPS